MPELVRELSHVVTPQNRRALSQAFTPGYDPYNSYLGAEEICLLCECENSVADLYADKVIKRGNS